MKQTNDVWFMAFLTKRGHKFKEYFRSADKKVTLKFDISDDEWKKLRVEFYHSELAEYKRLVRQFKDLGVVE